MIKRFIRKRTRWQYAVEHSTRVKKLWFFRDFVHGCIVLKRERVARERAARKAVEFLIESKLARLQRVLTALRSHAVKRIEKHRRRRLALRKALQLWMNRTANAALQRFSRLSLPACVLLT